MILSLLASLIVAATADTARWVVLNHGRRAGDLVVSTTRDSIVARFIYTDRNRGARIETRYRLANDGQPASGELRPIRPDGQVGDPTDRFETTADSVVFSGASGGVPNVARARREPGSVIELRGGTTPWEQAEVARHLLGAADRSAKVLPAGQVLAELIADTVLSLGGGTIRAKLVMIDRADGNAPSGVWLDEAGGLLATGVQWFIAARPDVIPLLPVFRRLELRWRDARAEAVASRVRSPVSGALVIRNGDLFDSERGVLLPRQTVVIRNDRIVAVGPADRIPVPSEATVIDASGKTVLPGMWEMHTHLLVSNEGTGSLVQLAQGLTTVRDLAADLDVAVSQRDRERAGVLASPRIVLAGFIEGPLAWAGPSEAIARDEAEARAWVARYDSLGYRQIKLYNVLHPDLLPVIAAEAKARGMRLSGHIPRGISIRGAVSLGYDEIQHAAFLLSDFFPDSLFLPRMRAYSQVAGVVAPTFDVNGKAMTSLIKFLAEHRTVIDGTFSIWIGGTPAWLGLPRSTSQEKADATYLRLIKRLYDGGVQLVAGTDNSNGDSYHQELALYERAGIPATKVLQIATIDAARVMKDDGDYGSVTAGKVADLIVVAGKPTERIADLAKVETVVRGGRLYRVADLLAAVRPAP